MFKALASLMATPVRVKALTYFFRRIGERGTVEEFAHVSGAPREDARREVAALARNGLITRRNGRKTPTYSANVAHPLAVPLTAFLTTATNPSNRALLNAFKGVRGITLLIAAGVLDDEPRSAADLIIVCRSPKSPAVLRAVRRAERLAALPLRYAVLGVEEYEERQRGFDRLLRDTLEYKHRILIEREPRLAE